MVRGYPGREVNAEGECKLALLSGLATVRQMPRRAAFGDGHPARRPHLLIGRCTRKHSVESCSSHRLTPATGGRYYDPTYADQGQEPKPKGKYCSRLKVSPSAEFRSWATSQTTANSKLTKAHPPTKSDDRLTKSLKWLGVQYLSDIGHDSFQTGGNQTDQVYKVVD